MKSTLEKPVNYKDRSPFINHRTAMSPSVQHFDCYVIFALALISYLVFIQLRNEISYTGNSFLIN